MARSLEPTKVGELDGLSPVSDGASGYHYQFARTPQGTSHVLGELREDDASHALGTQVLFGIGSGTHDRSFVVGHGAGMWFAPLEVLTVDGERRAVLAPHAAMEAGSRFSAPITAECLGCHTDDLPPQSFPLNRRHKAADWQPRGISCAACHGSTEAHAGWQTSYLAGQDSPGTDPVLVSGDLTRRQQLSLCATCHLQGDARIALDHRALGPTQPGTDVLEQRALFVARLPDEEVGFVSQVERLLLSRCFLESEMTCTTCHDPHRSLGQAEEAERVRNACQRCHERASGEPGPGAPAGPTTASPCSRVMTDQPGELKSSTAQDCVTCHMPRVGVFDVAQVQIHDHFIRRDTADAPGPTAADQLRFPESAEGDWKRFLWPDAGPQPSHADDKGLWLMAYAAAGHGDKALELVDQAAGQTAGKLPMYHHVRAGLLESAGRADDARLAYERALQLDPELAPSAVNLGWLLGSQGRVPEGLALLDGVLEKWPLAWSALRNRAVLYAQVGDLSSAKRDLERAFDALPSGAVAVALADLCDRRGERQAAARWRRLARELK